MSTRRFFLKVPIGKNTQSLIMIMSSDFYPRILREAGFSGPLCLEKVPGRSVAEVDVNIGKARVFMEKLVAETAGASGAAL